MDNIFFPLLSTQLLSSAPGLSIWYQVYDLNTVIVYDISPWKKFLNIYFALLFRRTIQDENDVENIKQCYLIMKWRTGSAHKFSLL